MPTRCSLLLALVALAPACGGAPAPPYKPVADVKTLMANIMEPAADEYWDAVGVVIDADGEHAIEPQTQEDWDKVRNNAYTFTEAGNLLMMPTRAKDNSEWMRLTQAFIDSGQKAIRAAESRDKAAVFDTGAEVYDACTACHAKYAVELQIANLRQ
jgi:cytochrome c556